jgi:putative DNA primase/helicase
VSKKGGVDAVKTRIDLALLHDPARILAAIEAVEPPTAAPKLLTEALLHVLWQSADFPESTREPLILAAAKRLQAATKLPRPPVKAVRNDTDRALREARDTQERREKTARERVRADQAKRQAEARRKQIATQRTTWPDGFEMRPDGFWFIPSDEQRGSPVWICGPFEVAGIAYSTANVEPSVYIRWTDENGVDHFPVLVARHFIHRPGNEIAETLERANLRCSPDALAHERLKKALGGVQSKNRLLIVSRTGWHDTKNGPVFVLPDQTFGPGGASVIMANATPPTIAIYGTKGTLEAWQNTVAKLATENDRLVLAISVPFGAPLLDMLAEPSGCIDLQGHSRIGKTTLLETTASVCGPPVGDDGQIITWRTTDNGLEGAAALRCDMAIPLDDTSKAGPDVLEQSVHMLSGGMSKQRANRDGTAQPRQFWRTLGFSTSNKTLAQRLAEIDKEPVGGMEARFSHVPADAHAGHGVYQNLHGRESGAALSQELHAAAMENYGTPIRAFLERLTNERAKNPDELLTALKDLHNAFMQKYVPVSADGQVISVACRFAVVAAGGELAIEFGQLPWQEGEALRGVGACFRAWLVARGNLGSVENRAIIAQVRHLIEPDGEGRFATFTRNDGPDDARARSVTRAGFRRRNAEGVWEYFVLPEVWRREYCRGHDPADVHDLMVKNGWSSWGADNRRSHRPYVPSEGNNVRSYFVSGANLGGDDDGVG